MRLHEAADGLLARIRVPGGRMSPMAWQALAAAARLGDGNLHVTSRGNVQIRGLVDADQQELLDLLSQAGLAPSATHDRARNILASPLAGRLAGHGPVGSLVPRLEAELLSRSSLSGLSGRFLFGLDDGAGDIARRRPDLGARWHRTGSLELLVAGDTAGVYCGVDSIAEILADLAEHFVSIPEHGWRLAPGTDQHRSVLAAARLHERTVEDPADVAGAGENAGDEHPLPEPHPPVGWIESPDGSVSLLAVTELAIIDHRLAEFLGAIDTDTTISPDRVLGIHGLSEGQAEQVVRVLAPMGLIFDANSPWVHATACIGSSGCSKSHADVHGDIRAAANDLRLDPLAQHWVGCDRACGWDHESTLYEAGPAGYVTHASPKDEK